MPRLACLPLLTVPSLAQGASPSLSWRRQKLCVPLVWWHLSVDPKETLPSPHGAHAMLLRPIPQHEWRVPHSREQLHRGRLRCKAEGPATASKDGPNSRDAAYALHVTTPANTAPAPNNRIGRDSSLSHSIFHQYDFWFLCPPLRILVVWLSSPKWNAPIRWHNRDSCLLNWGSSWHWTWLGGCPVGCCYTAGKRAMCSPGDFLGCLRRLLIAQETKLLENETKTRKIGILGGSTATVAQVLQERRRASPFSWRALDTWWLVWRQKAQGTEEGARWQYWPGLPWQAVPCSWCRPVRRLSSLQSHWCWSQSSGAHCWGGSLYWLRKSTKSLLLFGISNAVGGLHVTTWSEAGMLAD